jgi:hypothetical protein
MMLRRIAAAIWPGRTTSFLAALTVAAALANPVEAGDLRHFNEAVAQAYDHYRGAVFYLRTGNAAVASIELDEAAALWRDTVLPFAARPPDAFADDPGFAAAITDLGGRLEQGAAQAAGGEIEAARDRLLPFRDGLAALRARSGIVVFSDHVDAANAAMDRLWVFRHEPPDWDDAAQVEALRAAVAVTVYAYGRCRDAAPVEVADTPEFQRLVTGALASLERLEPAIAARDTTAVVNTLREVRSFDQLLWLHFG